MVYFIATGMPRVREWDAYTGKIKRTSYTHRGKERKIVNPGGGIGMQKVNLSPPTLV